jgi:hypothetical protein
MLLGNSLPRYVGTKSGRHVRLMLVVGRTNGVGLRPEERPVLAPC